ncbi:MAG: hypothetical protein RQ752_10660 [Thermohalobaculum sp.]|nr:hypothetical protein [Thermohalobaculum sp.]
MRAGTELPPLEVVDFALFGLAALSMSDNIEITVDQPVSASAARQIAMLAHVYHAFALVNIAPLRLDLTNIVADPSPIATGRKIVCFSGGADSTAGAVEAVTRHGYTHALLIAGADYPSADHPGFIDLRVRVGRMADRLGLGLVTVETDIRALRVNWRMTHALCIAMCLHAHGAVFDAGGFGADTSDLADLVCHPWGMSNGLIDTLGTALLPVDLFNRTLWRPERLARIISHDPALARDLAVCWVDTRSSGNCGTCQKCLRTRMNLQSLGFDASGMFAQTPDLLATVRALDVPASFTSIRLELSRMSEVHHFMPAGPLRTAVGLHVEQLREAYVAIMPSR